jgi:hypothetical protein
MSECDKIIKEFVDFSRCLMLDSDPVEVSVDFVKERIPSANKYTKEEIVDCFKKNTKLLRNNDKNVSTLI